ARTAPAAVRAALAAETGTLGLRSALVTKHVAPRRVETIEVRGTPVRMKIGPHGAKPEHDDLVAIARRDGIPLRVVAREALAVWSSQS
ncbi:MAG: nickel insertion protein, partial [Ilumatobacteraceae bacterium]